MSLPATPEGAAAPAPSPRGGALPQTADYGALLCAARPLIDLRAPVEFARGAFPAAHNLPLMSDAERAQVGRCYKERGQQAAIALGHELVGGATREARIEAWVDFARRHPQGALYCARGGLRSQIVQQWLAEAGVVYPRVIGGYKALRGFLLGELQRLAEGLRFHVVTGPTGSGKTHFLNSLPRAIDLEGLAHHRGSAFGAYLEEQPTPIDFENRLALALLDAQARHADAPVYLEDESRLIGRLALPPALHARIPPAPYVELQLDFAERVDGVLADYVLDLGRRYAQAYGERGPAEHEARLLGDLSRIRKRLGGAREQQVAALLREAFAAQARAGELDGHRAWIGLLLRDYYDPMYAYQAGRRAGPCLVRGRPEAVRAWVLAQGTAGAR